MLIEETYFVPPKGMLRVTNVYFRNFLVLPILELMSEILLYGNLCVHELSLAFFFYLRGFQNLLLDHNMKPTSHLF